MSIDAKKCDHDMQVTGPERGRNTPMQCTKCGARGGLIRPAPTPHCHVTGCYRPGLWATSDEPPKPICDFHANGGSLQ